MRRPWRWQKNFRADAYNARWWFAHPFHIENAIASYSLFPD